MDALCSQHFEYTSDYGHVTFGMQKLLLSRRQSLMYAVEEANDLRQSIWSKSDIRVEDLSIIDESVVDIAAMQVKLLT